MKVDRESETITQNKRFEIRSFRTSDLNRVEAINLSCLPENYTKPFYLMLYYRFPKTFLVATVHDVVVGYIMCRMEMGFSELRRFSLTKKGHIVSIAVLPEYRGEGIGKALILKAFEGMKEYGVGESYLEVRVSNKTAIHFYERLGFKVARIARRYYRDGEDAYVMAMRLA